VIVSALVVGELTAVDVVVPFVLSSASFAREPTSLAKIAHFEPCQVTLAQNHTMAGKYQLIRPFLPLHSHTRIWRTCLQTGKQSSAHYSRPTPCDKTTESSDHDALTDCN